MMPMRAFWMTKVCGMIIEKSTPHHILDSSRLIERILEVLLIRREDARWLNMKMEREGDLGEALIVYTHSVMFFLLPFRCRPGR